MCKVALSVTYESSTIVLMPLEKIMQIYHKLLSDVKQFPDDACQLTMAHVLVVNVHTISILFIIGHDT